MIYLILLPFSIALVVGAQQGQATPDPLTEVDTRCLVKKFADLVIVIGIPAGVLTLVVFVLIFSLYRACSHRQQRTLPAASSVATPQGYVATEATTSAVVPTQSVGSAVIGSFPLHSFPSEGSATFGDTCGICIEDFADGETLRSFPNCGHLYHSECLEGWLNGDGGKWCPCCKRDLVA
ncbi:RING-H2 finger protein ATL34 [Morus notabilis]|uniref:RING-H2 finger protein ATL34 n=1 Tax=Morus notabilis TaxID=981085 RepID=W9QJE3_9ROSA|nr:RING-H2 finger protein ATL34 [Morus notabilis]EXB38450.1 RING-H2 finger protein ATL34 [Morus notabilis]